MAPTKLLDKTPLNLEKFHEASQTSLDNTLLNTEKITEDDIIASLLLMERPYKREPFNMEKRFQKNLSDPRYSRVTSERWRESIVTVVRKGSATEFYTSPFLFIDTEELLSAREKEQRRLARKYFQRNFESDLEEIHYEPSIPSAFKELWDSYSEACSNEIKARRAKRENTRNRETVVHEEDFPPKKGSSKDPKDPPEGDSSDDPKQNESASQTTPMASNESASQTAPMASNESASQTAPMALKDSASQTTENVVGSGTELPTEQQSPAVVPEDIPSTDDKSSKPFPPSPQSKSTKKTKKDSKTDRSAGREAFSADDDGSSKTSPSSVRRSKRLVDPLPKTSGTLQKPGEKYCQHKDAPF